VPTLYCVLCVTLQTCLQHHSRDAVKCRPCRAEQLTQRTCYKRIHGSAVQFAQFLYMRSMYALRVPPLSRTSFTHGEKSHRSSVFGSMVGYHSRNRVRSSSSNERVSHARQSSSHACDRNDCVRKLRASLQVCVCPCVCGFNSRATLCTSSTPTARLRWDARVERM
jgi:hypothetical protein